MQPELVKCTMDGCERLVSIFAKACPACDNPDPAHLHESKDPQKRTVARKQYDESQAVVAWEEGQQRLVTKEKDLAAEAGKRRDKEFLILARQYYSGRFQRNMGLFATVLCFNVTATCAVGLYDKHENSPPISWLIAIGVPAGYATRFSFRKWREGAGKMRDANDRGYVPSYNVNHDFSPG
jgi:hypothetical protein